MSRMAIHSPEMEMFCPQPLRAFPNLPAFPYEEPGSFELSAQAKHCPSDWRPLSSVSTSAGPTPNPEDGFGSPQPLWWMDQEDKPQVWKMDPDHQQHFNIDRRSVQHNPCEQHRPQSLMGASMPYFKDALNAREAARLANSGTLLQQCKVFVGGVPQHVSQDELQEILSQYGEVKRAWLQRCRCVPQPRTGPPPKHRGFGFVMFRDVAAVERLLSGTTSRYLMLQCGRRLEVKRAVSADKMPQIPEPSEAKRPLAQGKRAAKLQASEVPVRQSEAHTQQLTTTAPPYMPWAESGGADLQSDRFNVMQGREPSTKQVAPRAQTSAPPHAQWAASGIGDWQGERADMFQASDGSVWKQQAHPPQLQLQARASFFSPWADDDDGQNEDFGTPQFASSMSHAGVCCADIMPSHEWMSPEAQWPQMGGPQLGDQSNRELEALLLRATPEFYDD